MNVYIRILVVARIIRSVNILAFVYFKEIGYSRPLREANSFRLE